MAVGDRNNWYAHDCMRFEFSERGVPTQVQTFGEWGILGVRLSKKNETGYEFGQIDLRAWNEVPIAYP